VKSDVRQRTGEHAEFPILCEGCLGENPFVRMLVDRLGGTCKMCDRPFTVFKWKPGRGEGFRKTEVCQTCAKVKNLCQTCILDLQLGLPSQLRDAVLAHTEGTLLEPESAVNKEYVAQQQLALLESEGGETLGEIANAKLLKIARTVGMNREQPRIKFFKPASNAKAITVNNQESSSLQRQINSDEIILPANPMDQIAASINLDRLPVGMKSFLSKQYGIDPGSDETQQSSGRRAAEDNNDEAETTKPVKKQKIKHFPRPPAGPPPASALLASSSDSS